MAAQDNTERKNQLNQQITDKRGEIGKCNGIKQKLVIEKGNLEKYQKKWGTQFKKHCNSKAASNVVIKNVFEGTVADKLKGYYGDQVDYMVKTIELTADLCKELDTQIRKLDSHVTTLQGEITTAQTELNNMEE